MFENQPTELDLLKNRLENLERPQKPNPYFYKNHTFENRLNSIAQRFKTVQSEGFYIDKAFLINSEGKENE